MWEYCFRWPSGIGIRPRHLGDESMASGLFALHVRQMLSEARVLSPDLQLAFEIAAEAVMLHDMIEPLGWCGLRIADSSGTS